MSDGMDFVREMLRAGKLDPSNLVESLEWCFNERKRMQAEIHAEHGRDCPCPDCSEHLRREAGK